MLAVTRNRTLVHYGHKHLCATHLCKVDKAQIDVCDHLNEQNRNKVTTFNEDLMTTKLYQLPEDKLKEIHNITKNSSVR